MPKNKTHSGAKKRFRVTGSGKIMRERANRRHLLEHKSTTRTRRLTGEVELAPADTKRVKRCSAAGQPSSARGRPTPGPPDSSSVDPDRRLAG